MLPHFRARGRRDCSNSTIAPTGRQAARAGCSLAGLPDKALWRCDGCHGRGNCSRAAYGLGKASAGFADTNKEKYITDRAKNRCFKYIEWVTPNAGAPPASNHRRIMPRCFSRVAARPHDPPPMARHPPLRPAPRPSSPPPVPARLFHFCLFRPSPST